MSEETQGLREFVDVKTNQVIGVVREEGASTREVVNEATNQIVRVVKEEGATTRSFVDTKTNEIKAVVRAEGATTRQFVDMKTNQVIRTVREEGEATRAFVDEKGNQVITVVKEEGAKTRTEVRSEGAKIREHIDVKTEEVKKVVLIDGFVTRWDANQNAAALKKHISTTSENVKKQVVKSQEVMTELTTKQFDQLNSNIEDATKATEAAVGKIADSGKTQDAITAAASLADCKDDMWTAGSKFQSAFKDYKATMAQLKELFREPALDDASMGLSEYYGNFNGKPLEKMPSVFLYIRNVYHLVQFDVQAAQASSWFPLKGRPNAFEQEYNQLAAVVRKLQNDQNYDLRSDFARVLKGEQVDIPTTTRWEDLRVSVKLPSRAVWEEVTVGIRTSCREAGPTYANTCEFYFKRPTYSDAYGLLVGALEDLERVRSQYRLGAAKRYSCRVATNVQGTKAPPSSRHLRALATMASNPNEPFFAMTYSTLVKVLLDYRLQEAADQFCKYYEFRNGGVAPPMCGATTSGATRPYYSLSTIQEMRSWQPPVYPRITSRIFLPTQPLVQAGTGRAYPFVDLPALAKGSTVTFDVPTWDLDWLKRYHWVPLNAKPETLASYYVESFRLYLPVEASGSSPLTSSLAVTMVAESSLQQLVTSQPTERSYQLPPQRFQFDVAYNFPGCASVSRAINPYHESAECVSTSDRSSQICLTQESTENSPRLLPTLFSSWRLRADVDLNSTQFRLVQPLATPVNSTTAAVDFNLFADVTLVRIAAASSRPAIGTAEENSGVKTRAAAASSCCARDEYRSLQSGVCTKCPENTIPALNGYTCTAK